MSQKRAMKNRRRASHSRRPAHGLRIDHGARSEVDPPRPSRYTAPKVDVTVRPRWHRWTGWLVVVAAVAVGALNDVMLMGEGLTLLPGGHSELYLLLAFAIAVFGTRFLGLFDRGTTVYADRP